LLSSQQNDRVSKDRSGFELPLLLVAAFRVLVDELHVELSRRGHDQARPIHGFALQALGAEGASTSELGRRLGVSKQAAAKTAANLEALGYATRHPHPDDGRAWVVYRTARGDELLAESAEAFERLRTEWIRRLSSKRVQALEDDLEAVVTHAGGAKLGDLPGWLR
jgi:DNA-binding MarR family transcriptional regulator